MSGSKSLSAHYLLQSVLLISYPTFLSLLTEQSFCSGWQTTKMFYFPASLAVPAPALANEKPKAARGSQGKVCLPHLDTAPYSFHIVLPARKAEITPGRTAAMLPP